jgi:hypothetical protein
MDKKTLSRQIRDRLKKVNPIKRAPTASGSQTFVDHFGLNDEIHTMGKPVGSQAKRVPWWDEDEVVIPLDYVDPGLTEEDDK